MLYGLAALHANPCRNPAKLHGLPYQAFHTLLVDCSLSAPRQCMLAMYSNPQTVLRFQPCVTNLQASSLYCSTRPTCGRGPTHVTAQSGVEHALGTGVRNASNVWYQSPGLLLFECFIVCIYSLLTRYTLTSTRMAAGFRGAATVTMGAPLPSQDQP